MHSFVSVISRSTRRVINSLRCPPILIVYSFIDISLNYIFRKKLSITKNCHLLTIIVSMKVFFQIIENFTLINRHSNSSWLRKYLRQLMSWYKGIKGMNISRDSHSLLTHLHITIQLEWQENSYIYSVCTKTNQKYFSIKD